MTKLVAPALVLLLLVVAVNGSLWDTIRSAAKTISGTSEGGERTKEGYDSIQEPIQESPNEPIQEPVDGYQQRLQSKKQIGEWDEEIDRACKDHSECLDGEICHNQRCFFRVGDH